MQNRHLFINLSQYPIYTEYDVIKILKSKAFWQKYKFYSKYANKISNLYRIPRKNINFILRLFSNKIAKTKDTVCKGVDVNLQCE